MSVYRTPGVYIESVLTYPARVLMTGVPVFLGLISHADLDACNARLPADRRFIRYPLSNAPGLSIVRKVDVERLPSRTVNPEADLQLGDPSSVNFRLHLRAGTPMPARAIQPPEGVAAQHAPDIGNAVTGAKPQRFTMWPQFKDAFGELERFGFLSYAVRGFFGNAGDLCYVQVICVEEPLTHALMHGALATLTPYNDYDLVCAPDLMWLAMNADANQAPDLAAVQMAILDHCESTGDRIALLDAPPDLAPEAVLAHRRLLSGNNGAFYYPWLCVAEGPERTDRCVPPCGHVAGIYNRVDRNTGVHKAPANEMIEGAINLARPLNDAEQAPLNDAGVNCLRVFTRRGIRVWGARTLSHLDEWRYVNVRRVFLTAGRWIERNMQEIVFEPHNPQLWERITRDLTAYLNELARRGALLGVPGAVSFYVKCDAETNPPELRETGRIVTEIGLAAAPPTEFIVVRVIHGPGGVQIEGPLPTAS